MEGIDLAIYSVAIFIAGMGAGLGLNWAGPDAWNLRTSVAHPIGSTPEGIDRATHAWVELVRGF